MRSMRWRLAAQTQGRDANPAAEADGSRTRAPFSRARSTWCGVPSPLTGPSSHRSETWLQARLCFGCRTDPSGSWPLPRSVGSRSRHDRVGKCGSAHPHAAHAIARACVFRKRAGLADPLIRGATIEVIVLTVDYGPDSVLRLGAYRDPAYGHIPVGSEPGSDVMAIRDDRRRRQIGDLDPDAGRRQNASGVRGSMAAAHHRAAGTAQAASGRFLPRDGDRGIRGSGYGAFSHCHSEDLARA